MTGIDKFIETQDKILKEAFKEHFGFEIENVKDTENLEHTIIEGNPISSFSYRNEIFLYWKDAPSSELNHNVITTTLEYRKV